jgi:hypothetical protein
MLTRKQLWRRVATRKNATTTSESPADPMPGLDRAHSEPIARHCQSPPFTLMERAQSSNDLAGPPKKKKHVQFSPKAKVVLIPCLNEYRSHQMHQELWWKDDDYLQFKLSASKEISHSLKMGGIKNILTQLYQSHQAPVEGEIRTL